MFTPEEEILRGQREYYNLEFDEHKYLLQEKSKKIKVKSNTLPASRQEIKVKSENQSANSQIRESENHFFSEVFNIAYGGNTTLNQLFTALRDNLAKFDEKIKDIEPEYGPFRVGDIPHSQASILKAKTIIGYEPEFNAKEGFELAAEWYYKNPK